MRTQLRIWFGLLICLLGTSLTAAERLPVPDAAAQKSALASVKEVFRQDLAAAKTSIQQRHLARRMLGSLEEKPEAATANYILLVEAQGLAVKGADAELARKMIDELVKRYEVDSFTLRAAVIRDLGKVPTDNQLHTSLAQDALSLAQECVEQERFETALATVELASSLAQRTKNVERRRQITARKAEVTELQKLWDEFRKARETLKQSPENPAANDVIGRYLIVVKSDWNQGLTHWVHSPDKDLQQAAKRDDDAINAPGLAGPVAVAELADGWWDLAAKQTSPGMKAALKLRAGQWYASMVGGTEGLTKAKITQRITDSGWSDESVFGSKMPRNRTWQKLQQRLQAAEGWLPGMSVLCQAAPFAEALSLNEALSHWQYRPHRFRPYRTRDGLKVAAIWHKDRTESRTSLIAHGSEYEMYRRDTELREQGYFARDVAGYYNDQGELEFTLVWDKHKPDGGTDTVLVLSHRLGMKLEQSTAALLPLSVQQFWNKDKEIIDNQIRRKPGGAHLHVWGPRAGITKTFESTKDVCDDICLASQTIESDISKLHWSANLSPRPGIKFVEVFHSKFSENLADWRKLSADGFLPVAIGAVQLTDGSTVSSTIWHGSAK